MDFSNVKTIISSSLGEITKITNSLGQTLWQKISRILKEWRGSTPLTCVGTVADDFFEAKVYGESVQDGGPTPENPVEILSCGTKTKNLFDVNNAELGYWYSSSGAKLEDQSGLVSKKIYCSPGDTFTFSCSGNKPYNIGVVLFNDASFLSRTLDYLSGINKVTFTIPNNANNFCIIASHTTAITKEIADGFKLQLEEGDTATEYEPYGYKVPIEVSGKNLFDMSEVTLGKTIRSDGVIIDSDTVNTSDFIEVKQNETYIRSIDEKATGNYYHEYNENKEWLRRSAPGFEKPFTITNTDCKYIRFMIDNATLLKNFQLEEGSTVTSYQEYQAPVTTNIFLDEPLRKLSTYADTLSVKGTEVTVTRNVGTYTCTGDESWSIYDNRVVMPNTDVTEKLPIIENGAKTPILLCNYFKFLKWTKSGPDIEQNKITAWKTANNSYIRFGYTGTPDEWKELTTNKMYLLYPLATPTTETISIENAIQGVQGTSIINIPTETKCSELYISQYAEQ